MQNYRNILTYADFALILEFFEDRQAKEFYKQTGTIQKYLKKAYQEAEADGFKDCQKFSIEEYMTYLHDLHWMAVNTTVFKNQALIVTDEEKNLKINVLPWIDFIQDNGGLADNIATLSVMKGVVVNYSNGGNTSLTKEIYRFIEDLENLFEIILDRHTELK